MFWTFSIVLTVVWLMGVVTGYTIGGAVHVLPVFAVIAAFLGGFKRRHRDHHPRWSGSGRGLY